MSKNNRLFWVGCLLSLVWSAWVPAARGQVFVSYPFPNHQIRQYTENGVATVFASGLNLPNGLAFDSSGLLYAVNNGDGSLVKFPAVPVPGVAQAPVAFAPASGNGLIALTAKATDLYAGNFVANVIRRFPVGGGASSVFASAGMNGPSGLAFDTAGNLYVANRIDNTITMLDLNGTPSLFATGVSNIRGLTWRAGVLYVATGGNNAILNFTATGNTTGTLFPSTYTGVTDPRDLAFDGVGNLYVAAATAIVKFANNGTILWSVPTGAETPAFIAVQSACEPAVVTCPVNKTVDCGVSWTFDPPVASNATITVTSTVTNGLCPLVVTRAWQIVSACGVTNTCAQTVTVAPSLNFTSPNSPAVISGPIFNPANGHVYYLLGENTWTASEAEAVALGGHLATVRSPAENNWIYAQFSQFGGVNRGLWIGLNDAGSQDGNFVWASGEAPGSYLNWGSGEPRNQDGLDDYVHLFWPGDPRASQWNDQWDIIGSQFAGIPINGVVEVSNFPPLLACATNKTVECGVAWTFDAPLASGLCGDTNVTVSVSGTVTNGSCPLVITRTWLATDACGNTNVCSQTVTVRDTTPPALVCATNKAVPCGTAWNFDAPLATDGCGANAAGPAPVTVSVLNTVTNSLCPLTVTRTWQATDACGNTNVCSQTVTVNPPPPCAGCETWTARETNRVWYGVASSADGSKLVAVEYAGDIYTSSDSGLTWLPRPVAGGFHGWIAVASDATGQYLVAVANPGQIFTSADSGVSWVVRTTGNKTWVSVASDSTGKYLVAAGDNDDLHTSSDYGVTWTARVAGTGVRHWHDVASDTSGKNLIAVGYGGLIFTSHDYGVTWTAQNGSGLDWQSVASDATGTKLVAGVYQGLIYTSADGGVTWAPRASAGSHSWDGLASSADGNKLVAVSFSNRIYCSTDSGVTWTPHESSRQWSSVAASADASKLVAVVYGGGQIYTSSCPPALILTGAPDKTVEAGTVWSFDPPVVVGSCGGNNAAITVSGTVTNGVCPLVITRTWQATDACTNSATWHQTVTVADTAPPILACATNKTVICGAPWNFDAPAASDVFSGTNVTVTILGTVTNGVCPQVITRTWLATDLCGNTNTCTQIVTIQNTVAPLIQCPANIFVTSCTNTVVRYVATATSGCCENVTLVLTPPSGTVFFPGTTNTVQAVATDCCGNTSICEFTVTVACAPDPCREFVVNGSFELASPALLPNSFNDGLDPLSGVPGWTTATTNFLEIWRDNAGFPASEGVQQLEINARSADQTVSQVVTGLSTNCPVQFCFDYTGRFAGNAAGPPRNNFTVTLTSGTAVFSVALNPNAHSVGGWLHFCTNFVPATSTVTIEFHGRPNFPAGSTPVAGGAHIDNVSLTQCCTNNACIQFTAPRDKQVECGKAWGFDAPANIVDACCDSFSVNFTTVTNGHCPQVITRTWLIADKCGNTSSVSQTVTVSGSTPPILTCATNKIVQCDAKWEFDQPAAVDACSSKEVELAVLRTVTNGTPCRTEITRTWQATDACGNIATCSQTVTVVDTTPPVLLCPRDKTVKCGKVWKFDQPEAVDNCCGKAVEIQVLDTSTNGVCPQVITRTWAAVDCCGNRSRCSQTVTVVDVTPPVFTSSLPVLVDEAVILARPLGDLGVVSPGVTLGQTFTVKTEGTLAQVDVWIGNKRPDAKVGGDLILEVREVDAKGLPMEEDALASVVIPARSIPAVPGWVTVPLPNELPVMPGQALAIVLSVADTTGDAAYEWLGADEDLYKGGALYSLSTRGWGLVSLGHFDGSFTIYVRPPICGTNRKVICGRPWSFPTPRVTDNCCVSNVTLAILSTVTNGVCPQVVTRTWVATDCCGNTNTCTQTVSAYPRIPIVITDIKVTAGGPRFAFATEEGETYAIEYKNTIADRAWTMLQTVKGDGTEKQVVDDSKQANIRFYQVRLVSP